MVVEERKKRSIESSLSEVCEVNRGTGEGKELYRVSIIDPSLMRDVGTFRYLHLAIPANHEQLRKIYLPYCPLQPYWQCVDCEIAQCTSRSKQCPMRTT